MAKLREANIIGHFISKPYGFGSSVLMQGMAIAEISRVDAGVATFTAVQAILLMSTID